MPYPPRVSAIVPTYQRRATLPAVVQALLADPELHELIVVDDGSTDGSAEWLHAQGQRDRRLVVLRHRNAGAPAARQAGLEAATGEVVLFLDDDVVAPRGLAGRHAHHHARARGLLVQGYMPNEWRDKPPGKRAIARIYRRGYELHCSRYEREPEHVLFGMWAGNFSLRREDALRVGVLPPSGVVVPHGNDRELGIRCYEHGLEGVFDRSVRAEHRYDRDLAGFRRDCRASGVARRMIHDLHPQVVGEDLDDRSTTGQVLDQPGMGLPRAVRPLLRLLARPLPFAVVTTGLAAVFRLGVVLRSLRLETLAARGIGSLETQRGVFDAAAGRAPHARAGRTQPA